MKCWRIKEKEESEKEAGRKSCQTLYECSLPIKSPRPPITLIIDPMCFLPNTSYSWPSGTRETPKADLT
ncbi:BnaC04g24060D [Brassica napus]|uniref:BnaC04g24060D protein n=2 Tax=Brassica TaxID=3705 RepID=A0A078IE69_BRANA|nr:BnaC04g24060D [Brassica napus]VDD09570.1 unnamed protein product [Brassica oleracea]